MTDWIEKLKRQQESKNHDQLERERLLQRRLERFGLKLWQFIQDTKVCLVEGIKALRVGFPNDGRYHLRYQPEGEGFSLGGTLQRTAQLTLALDSTKTELRTTVSLGRSSSAANVYIDTGLDEGDHLFVEFEGERYYIPKEFAKALMSYVIGVETPKASQKTL